MGSYYGGVGGVGRDVRLQPARAHPPPQDGRAESRNDYRGARQGVVIRQLLLRDCGSVLAR